MSKGKAIGTAVAVVVIGYFLVLPMFWMGREPDAVVTMPDTWQHDVDLPIHVRVTSIHPNVIVQEVRVVFDYAPADNQGTPYPRILHQVQKTKNWSIFEVNRCTWPCSDEIEVVLPLAELARDDGVRAGLLKGQLQVAIDYVRALDPASTVMGTVMGQSRTVAIPYELTLQ